MNKSALVIIIFVLLLGLGWLAWSDRSVEPLLTITNPNGGEEWSIGETRTISWQSEGINEDSKVAISIRRIPPPPLSEIGQEFDPVIFTELPNTGSVDWEISTEYPEGTYVLSLNSYESLPVTDPVMTESAQFTIRHPELSDDLYPLYPHVEWGVVRGEEIMVGSETVRGASVGSSFVEAGMDPASVYGDLREYYEDALRPLGWDADDSLAADGITGGQVVYRRDNETILIHHNVHHSVRPENAPLECPCEVDFYLFSAE